MPSINSTGGIFLRLDSSGNLNIYDTSGTTIAKFIGGLFSSKLNRGTSVTTSPITTTTSTVYVHTGYVVQLTPQVSGAVLMIGGFAIGNNTAADGAALTFYYQAGTLTPSGGDAVTGWTATVGGSSETLLNNNSTVPCNITTLQTGLTTGTAYTFALCVKAVTGGTASLASATNPQAWEI